MDQPETQPPQSKRTPQLKADEDMNETIRQTLMRPDVNYDRMTCARLLGLNYGRVDALMQRDPFLRTKIPEANSEKMVPEEAEIIDRKPQLESLLPADQVRMVKALIKQNDKVIKKGWRDIGLEDDEAQAMEDAERRASLPIGRVLGASEGHMISLLAKSAMMLDKLGDQLVKGKASKHGDLPVITDMAGSDKTQAEFMKIFQSGAMVHINLQSILLKTRASTIEAMKKLKELQQESAKPEKGVFEVEEVPKSNG